MRVDEPPLKDWITDIRNSEIALPRFQRGQEWEKGITEKFLTSVIRDLPTGTTLSLEVRGESPFEYRYLPGAPKDEDQEPDKLLLDGQQRLTAVWKSLNNLYEDRSYLLDLKGDRPSVVSVKRYERSGREGLYPLWIDTPEECWERKKVPLWILNPDKPSREARNWCKKAIDDSEERDDVLDKLFEIRDQISGFNLPCLCLEKGADPNDAIDVFIKLNTSYVSLSSFDIVVARTEAQVGESLHKKLKELLEECPEIEDYRDPKKYVLDVACLLQDKRPTKKNKEERLDFQRMIGDWRQVISGTKELINFLEQERIFDKKRLPTHVILAPLAVLQTLVPSHPDERGNAKRLLKKYLWRSFFTNRYERTTTTKIIEDYRALKKRVNGVEVAVPCFDEDEHPLPKAKDLREAGWPTKKDRLGRAILSLTFQASAKNFADDEEISKRNIQYREYHHLYPKRFLKNQGVYEENANKALNCALIRWEDNRIISGKSPLEYLLERSAADNLGEPQIRKRLESHLIDYDVMVEKNYDKFLHKRALDMVEKIENLCEGKEFNT